MRHKPSKSLRDSTHAASAADLEILAKAVLVAIINRQKNLILKYPYFATFEESYPKGIIVKKDGVFDFYKVKVAKLADWLCSKGALPDDYKGIMKSQRDWGYREARLTRMLSGEIVVDKNVEKCDNDGSDLERGEE